MTGSARRSILSAALVGLLVSAPGVALAGERKAVPKSSAPRATSASPARSRTTPRATAARTVPPKTTVSGRARYGYGGHGGYYPYWSGHRWYPRYDPWWSFGLWWGWPYPYWAPYQASPVYVYPDRVVDVGPASLETDVAPRRSVVRLDGDEIGRAKDYNGTWDVLPLAEGRHVVEFDAPGYQTLRVIVDAEPGQRYRVDYALQRGEGLDPRSSKEPVGGTPKESAVDVEAGPPPALQKGFLDLRVAPPDAAVYLDGSFFARADEIARMRGAIPLVVGTHRVEVVRPGYASRSIEITVEDEEPVSVSIELERQR